MYLVINSVQLLHDFNEIFSNDTVAKNKLKMVTKRIFDIFNLATDLSADETFKLISSFILGTEENELISDKEAYDNYINYHLSLNEYIKPADFINNNKITKTTSDDVTVDDKLWINTISST